MEADIADAAVLARMRAAVRVLRAAGLEVDTGDDRDSHLSRAVYWQRYSRGPVPALNRVYAMDIVRGSLRLWSAAGGVPVAVGSYAAAPPGLARVQRAALVRNRCAALRADLGAEAAALSRRRVDGFEDRVRGEMLRVWLEVLGASGAASGQAGESAARRELAAVLPPRRRPRLENQLTMLLGAGFGAGLTLTVGRLVTTLCPGPAAAVCCGLLGLALTVWTVLARHLLAERNAAERWMLEAVANLRPALEERVVTRNLTVESHAE